MASRARAACIGIPGLPVRICNTASHACRVSGQSTFEVLVSSRLHWGAAGGTTAAQLVLGVATLMSYVPISLGVAHQGGGVAVWSALLILCHTLRLPVPR